MVKLVAASAVCVLTILSLSCQAQPRGQLFRPAPGPPPGMGARPNSIDLGDLNRDGKLDAVTCNEGNTVTVWLGDGRGRLAPAPGSPLRLAAHLVAARDVNNDRNLDLVLT